jgi:hypothetical protein
MKFAPGRRPTAAIAMKDGFRGARRCCSAISVYDALAGEKVLTAQNTVAACAKTFANSMQPLVYLKVEQSRMARGYNTGGRTSGMPTARLKLSSTANTPGRLVSSRCGARGSGQCAAASSSCDRSAPVLMNPCASHTTQSSTQRVLGAAPVTRADCRLRRIQVDQVLPTKLRCGLGISMC